MIGMLLVSHGRMAEGMLDSLELIMGSCDRMHTVSLCAGEDFESFRVKVMEAIRQLEMVYWYLSIFTELLRLMRLFMQWPEWRRRE